MSSLSGVKLDTVQFVLEYLIYQNFLEILDDPNAKITIPFLGDISVTDRKINVNLTDNFQEELYRIKKGDVSNLKAYFEQHWLDKLVEEIQEE
jgi:hypothetical protein